MQPEQTKTENKVKAEADANTAEDAEFAQMSSEVKDFFGWWNANRVMALFTVVIAFIGVLQACIYSSELDEMRIDQRAWLGVKFVSAQPILNSYLPAQLVVNNTGKTPAKNITGEFTAGYLGSDTPIDFRSREELKAAGVKLTEDTPLWGSFSTGVLFPNDPTMLPPFILAKGNATKPLQVLWDTTLQGRYTKGEIYIEWHGRFDYKDAVGNYHWTQFCNIIMAPGKGIPKKITDACAAYTDMDSNK